MRMRYSRFIQTMVLFGSALNLNCNTAFANLNPESPASAFGRAQREALENADKSLADGESRNTDKWYNNYTGYFLNSIETQTEMYRNMGFLDSQILSAMGPAVKETYQNYYTSFINSVFSSMTDNSINVAVMRTSYLTIVQRPVVPSRPSPPVYEKMNRSGNTSPLSEPAAPVYEKVDVFKNGDMIGTAKRYNGGIYEIESLVTPQDPTTVEKIEKGIVSAHPNYPDAVEVK